MWLFWDRASVFHWVFFLSLISQKIWLFIKLCDLNVKCFQDNLTNPRLLICALSKHCLTQMLTQSHNPGWWWLLIRELTHLERCPVTRCISNRVHKLVRKHCFKRIYHVVSNLSFIVINIIIFCIRSSHQ